MILVDSCGWLEYFCDGPLAEKYYSYLKNLRTVITPTIVVYEVYKKIRKEKSEESALLAVAQIKETEIIPLTESLALSAADVSLAYTLPIADAMVYATGKTRKAKIITSDWHFKNLENVVFIEK